VYPSECKSFNGGSAEKKDILVLCFGKRRETDRRNLDDVRRTKASYVHWNQTMNEGSDYLRK